MQEIQSATSEPQTTPLDNSDEPASRHINSVDATMGQPLVARVMARKLEMEGVLALLREEDLQTRTDIGIALAIINDLLTGDLANVPAVVAVDMNRWLERNKHLAERNAAPAECLDLSSGPTLP